ncbi:CRISPR system precrRNA processing endoribonuclease RAMP protein Cas6 [Acidiphilium sp.]|jgi:hypothetical protein|uniref:CRISPR system precrRNA processing endoribonuclease RAMP protein Cas6 n=1 Tax=Acidiphilium sp. TaxID=527 RepID=UPI00258DCC89|nr:CRISPR system precrRNA processing endoribonuclease RAMP protein Cas6 [Acidiphilium sp.]
MSLETDLRHALAALRLRARRLFLATPGVLATVPMIRGVWGAALRAEDEAAYRCVFVGGEDPSDRLPTYLFRPASRAIADPPALEWIVFGNALDDEAVMRRAWARAATMGLGPERRPFSIRRTEYLHPDGTAISAPTSWRADQALWPLSPGQPCHLVFPAPLRLLKKKRLVTAPTLLDLIEHALRRLAALAGPEGAALKTLTAPALGAAEAIRAAPWDGRPLDLVRYSGAQKQEVELHGVTGTITLPHGPGPLWPLLAALAWTHLGKGTVFGLGQMLIIPMTRRI